MKKLMFFMILTVAAGTYTMSFATDSGGNYKHQNETIDNNQKASEPYLINSSNYKHQNGERRSIRNMNRKRDLTTSSDYKHHN